MGERIVTTNKRKIQGAKTKKKIYEIATKLFLEQDFMDVNIQDITDAAGISKGAFYVHFESKDALIALIITDLTAKVDMDYKLFLEEMITDMSACDTILALIEKITNVLENTIGHANMSKIYQILLAKTVDTDAVKGYKRQLYKLFYDILENGIQKGEFKNVLSIEVLSQHFVMAIRGISYEWCIRYPVFDLKEQSLDHFKLLLEGIKINKTN